MGEQMHELPPENQCLDNRYVLSEAAGRLGNIVVATYGAHGIEVMTPGIQAYYSRLYVDQLGAAASGGEGNTVAGAAKLAEWYAMLPDPNSATQFAQADDDCTNYIGNARFVGYGDGFQSK